MDKSESLCYISTESRPQDSQTESNGYKTPYSPSNNLDTKSNSESEDLSSDPLAGISMETLIIWESILLNSSPVQQEFIFEDSKILSTSLDLQNQKVIKNDCLRTRVRDKDILPGFQTSLEILLTFYCKQHGLLYKQGLNEILAPFLLLQAKLDISTSRVYNLFVAFTSKFISNFFCEAEFESLQNSLSLMELLLRYHDPKLFHILEFALVRPEMYATSWLLTLFSK